MEHPALISALEETKRLPPLSMRACRGLSYTETACFAGLLQLAPRSGAVHLRGLSGHLVQRALQQLDDHPQQTRQELGRAILDRLNRSRHLSIALLHTEWVERLHRTERAKVAATVLGFAERPDVSPAERWLRDHSASQCGLFDPRHLHEWRRGEVLEPDMLRLAPKEDLATWIQRIGLAMIGSICNAAGPNYKAAMARKLGVHFGRRMADALHSGPPVPEGSSRLAVTRFGSRRALSRPNTDLLSRIERVGLFIVACALAFRDAVYFDGVAHALPHRFGEAMLVNRSNIVTDQLAQQIHEPLLRWSMESLMHLSALGQTVGSYHERNLVLDPIGAKT
ncbi:MAG: hypothetical protein CMH57_13610 [Myxococcales bacterium]|nr:hypothetical protein [Myxococcales bacterium]